MSDCKQCRVQVDDRDGEVICDLCQLLNDNKRLKEENAILSTDLDCWIDKCVTADSIVELLEGLDFNNIGDEVFYRLEFLIGQYNRKVC